MKRFQNLLQVKQIHNPSFTYLGSINLGRCIYDVSSQQEQSENVMIPKNHVITSDKNLKSDYFRGGKL